MTELLATNKERESLTRAARDLQEATHAEHISLIEFTDKLEDLQFAITRLEHTCLTFQARMKRVDVSKLRRRSLRLARIMSSASSS